MNDTNEKMSAMKEIYDSALKTRGKKKKLKNPTGMMSNMGEMDMDDTFGGNEEEPLLTISIITGSGLPESEMLDEAKADKKESEEEEEPYGMQV